MFSLSYDGVNTTSVSMNNLTAETLQQALNNLTSVREQGKVNVTELNKNENSTAYRVTFYFENPEETRMLFYNSVASDMTSVKITRLQKGECRENCRIQCLPASWSAVLGERGRREGGGGS